MSTTVVRRKTGNLLPVLDVDISYKDPALQLSIPLDTPVTFSMRLESSDTRKINAAASSIVSSMGGIVRVRYEWAGTDTDTPGDYLGEFTFTVAGKPLTAPSGTPIRIVIGDNV